MFSRVFISYVTEPQPLKVGTRVGYRLFEMLPLDCENAFVDLNFHVPVSLLIGRRALVGTSTKPVLPSISAYLYSVSGKIHPSSLEHAFPREKTRNPVLGTTVTSYFFRP